MMTSRADRKDPWMRRVCRWSSLAVVALLVAGSATGHRQFLNRDGKEQVLLELILTRKQKPESK